MESSVRVPRSCDSFEWIWVDFNSRPCCCGSGSLSSRSSLRPRADMLYLRADTLYGRFDVRPPPTTAVVRLRLAGRCLPRSARSFFSGSLRTASARNKKSWRKPNPKGTVSGARRSRRLSPG